jgi:hypothetical protein
MRVRWIAYGSGARHAPANCVEVAGQSLPLLFAGGTSPGVGQDDFNSAICVDLAAVTFARVSLRCRCFEQRVHSGLYNGLTWPDTGFASFD